MKDFIELLKENARNYPQRIAIIDKGKQISYADLLTVVNTISNELVKISCNPKVVFDLTQGIEAYALIIAVLNVGGIFCPLNPESPIERKTQIIHEFNPHFIVVESEEKLLEIDSDKVVAISKLYSAANSSEISARYYGDDIIYIIYTSGSTGMPKGVKICRKALNKFLEWSVPTYGASENDIWGQFSLLSFDLSIVDIFTCLCSGATLYAMNDTNAKRYRPASEIEKVGISIWHSIPSAVEFMIKNEESRRYDFSSLRLMSFCGETLLKHQVEFLFEKKKNITIFNTYGPTEGTLFCTWQQLEYDNYNKYCQYSLSIGKPIPGWNLKLDTIDGFEGKEIVLFGEYIGKGYLSNVPDSKFKTIDINGKKVESFQTGDIVNEENGNLFFSGRKDRQVKIKGYRIELDEIDLRVREFLHNACVTILYKRALYSFVETDGNINEDALRSFLKMKLESYKIPNKIYTISEIPRNQNQKIDINSLIKKII